MKRLIIILPLILLSSFLGATEYSLKDNHPDNRVEIVRLNPDGTLVKNEEYSWEQVVRAMMTWEVSRSGMDKNLSAAFWAEVTTNTEGNK